MPRATEGRSIYGSRRHSRFDTASTQVGRSMVETRIPEAAIDGAPSYGQGLYRDQPEDRLLPSGTFASAAPDRT
jgi:hypothetical protein